MADKLDILCVDAKIRTNFQNQFNQIDQHKRRLIAIEDALKDVNLKSRFRTNLEQSKRELLEYINNLEKQIDYNFYIIQTTKLIDDYKNILKIPLKITFLGKQNKHNKSKQRIIHQYLLIASQYTTIDMVIEDKSDDTIVCSNCQNKKDFDIIDHNTYICMKCYAQQTIMKHISSSYNDIDRINISSKYMYDRKIHFRDCIKQYQGKQNSSIPTKIYKNLEEQLMRHHLLTQDGEDRFKNVTKNHILLFLKELGYSNHYENVNLIHYTLTGIKPDDISYLEDQLLTDFDALTDLYDKEFKHIKRKNFINTQYVLYQLLCRHKHACNKEEFIILKTIDRKFFHDEICKVLFEQLNWNHSPYY